VSDVRREPDLDQTTAVFTSFAIHRIEENADWFNRAMTPTIINAIDDLEPHSAC
jgi:hypothetical protein